MVHIYPNETWREFFPEHKLKLRYAVSNYGRLMSFVDTFQGGTLLKGGKVDGYTVFRYKITRDKKLINKHLFVRKLVAEHFLKKTSEDQVYVLLLDRNRSNNFVENLKWATKKEMLEHSKCSPKVLLARENLIEFNKQRNGHKLTSSTVRIIKKKIFSPNRKTRMKMIAKQYGISEMQLYRIKSGENWGHIKID